MRHVLPAFLTLLMGAGAAEAQWWDAGETPGALAGVSIEVDGRRVPLYAAPDGSPRWYLEAREGSTYAVVLSNRTAERLGVVLTVDGLNAISGERDSNRMYVLGPWEQSTIRGWRTSLADVRRFTFVDERASYAARSGKANSKMGWIQAAIYRERRRYVHRRPEPLGAEPWREESSRSEERDRAGEAAPLPEGPPPAAADAPSAKLEAPRDRSRAYPGGGSFPGTGLVTATSRAAATRKEAPRCGRGERAYSSKFCLGWASPGKVGSRTVGDGARGAPPPFRPVGDGPRAVSPEPGRRYQPPGVAPRMVRSGASGERWRRQGSDPRRSSPPPRHQASQKRRDATVVDRLRQIPCRNCYGLAAEHCAVNLKSNEVF